MSYPRLELKGPNTCEGKSDRLMVYLESGDDSNKGLTLTMVVDRAVPYGYDQYWRDFDLQEVYKLRNHLNQCLKHMRKFARLGAMQ